MSNSLKRAAAALQALKLAALQNVCFHTFEGERCIHCNKHIKF